MVDGDALASNLAIRWPMKPRPPVTVTRFAVRQLFITHGNSVAQECRGILAEIRKTLGTLQRNAADRARQKRSAGREKGKHF